MTRVIAVGFTGTRRGMSDTQKEQLALMLRLLRLSAGSVHDSFEFHHGGAEGADTEAWEIAAGLGYDVTVHPCPGVTRQSLEDGAQWREVFPPLHRNRNIVADSMLLIAGPRADKEEARSGTWATVRYARGAMKPVVMLSRGPM